MAVLEKSGLNQKAVLWPVAGVDANGDPIVSSPIEIDTHWESAVASIMGNDDTPIATTAIVMVDREIATQSIMRLGKLEDLPEQPDKLLEVVGYEGVPDVKGKYAQHTALIRRWKDSLPEIV